MKVSPFLLVMPTARPINADLRNR